MLCEGCIGLVLKGNEGDGMAVRVEDRLSPTGTGEGVRIICAWGSRIPREVRCSINVNCVAADVVVGVT